MAKVITEGYFTKVHRSCNSLIEYTAKDIRQGRDVDYLGDYDEYNYIMCPFCHRKMIVTEDPAGSC